MPQMSLSFSLFLFFKQSHYFKKMVFIYLCCAHICAVHMFILNTHICVCVEAAIHVCGQGSCCACLCAMQLLHCIYKAEVKVSCFLLRCCTMFLEAVPFSDPKAHQLASLACQCYLGICLLLPCYFPQFQCDKHTLPHKDFIQVVGMQIHVLILYIAYEGLIGGIYLNIDLNKELL